MNLQMLPQLLALFFLLIFLGSKRVWMLQAQWPGPKSPRSLPPIPRLGLESGSSPTPHLDGECHLPGDWWVGQDRWLQRKSLGRYSKSSLNVI